MVLLNEKPYSPSQQELAGGGGLGLVFYLGGEQQRRLTWEHLETIRLKRLGIPNRYSRYLHGGTPHGEFVMPREKHPLSGPNWTHELKKTPENGVKNDKEEGKKKPGGAANNSLAPFHTNGKPTCGYFFSRTTDNKKKKFGIPPSDLVKWRTFAQ